MAAAKKQCFLRFLHWTESSPTVIQSPRFTNDYIFGISISSRNSKLSFLTILLFIDCSKMARIRINTRDHTKGKPYLINSYFFQSWLGKKGQ